MEVREVEEPATEGNVVLGGLGLLDSNRRVTRSVARALENQVVGSIFTQIDTGIPHPVDFIPTDFLNRCAERVFGRASQESRQPNFRVIEPVALNTTDNSLTFSQKIEELCQMPEEEQPRGSMQTDKQQPDGTEPQGGGPSSATLNVEQLSRMMAMMAQQSDMMAECMNEVRHMRDNVMSLNNRVAEVETSVRASGNRPAMASTPEASRNRNAEPDRQGLGARSGNHGDSRLSDEAKTRKKIDLEKWHIKFDGSSKGISVESFIFRVEKMRAQLDVSYYQLFTDFHCLVTGSALKWYWQLLEDHAENPDFGYHELKTELLAHFKTAESDYEVIREIMERKQSPQETFEEFYCDVHNLTFRLKKKIPEHELVGIIRGNLKPYLANLTFASQMATLAELKAECKRAEKVIKENRNRPKAVNELEFIGCEKVEEKPEYRNVEAIGRVQGNKPQQVVSVPNPVSPSPNPNVQKPTIHSFCPSPFHLMLCFKCGLPVDHFVKNPLDAQKVDKCQSKFHNMICFACGSDSSFCVYKPNPGNLKLAEISGKSGQQKDHPESTQ